MMKQYSVLFFVAGGMALSSTLAAYAMMDAPSAHDLRANTSISSGRIQKEDGTISSPSEKLKPRCNENISNSGAIHCEEVKNSARLEKLQERKKLQREKKQQEKDLLEMRDVIIEKLLAGESLSDAEKAEAKIMLAERKERKTEIKNRIEEAKAS